MICPHCEADDSAVEATRKEGGNVRRQRGCNACGRTFTTLEVVRDRLLEAAVDEQARQRRAAGHSRSVA